MNEKQIAGFTLSGEQWKFVKFLIAGGYNTLFSFALFAGLYLLLGEKLHYVLIAVVTHIIAIANSFLVHKFFVFKAEGNILGQAARSYLVYGITMLASLATLALLVELFHLHPILAQALTIVVSVAISYIGNSRFTFKSHD